MSIWNKILLFLIFVTGAFFVVLVSNMHQLAKQNNEKLLAQEKKLLELTQSVAKLHGEIFSDSKEVVLEWNKMPLNAKMNQLIALRGGNLWLHCTKPGLPQQNGDFVQTSFCLPETIKPQRLNEIFLRKNAPIFIFDSGVPAPREDGQASDAQETAATFLGVFHFNDFNEAANEVLIESMGVMTEEELERLTQSIQNGNEWFVYVNKLPIDSPALLTEWLSDPNDTVAPLLSGELKKYLLQQSDAETTESDDMTVEEMTLDVAADTETATDTSEPINEEDPFSVQADENQAALDTLAQKERLPVDYNERIYSRTNRRMLLNLSVEHCQNTINDLLNIFCDQFAYIGVPELPEDVLNQIGPIQDEGKKAVQAFTKAQTTVSSQTLMAKKEEQSKLVDAALSEVDLVKNQLEKAAAAVSGLDQRIAELVNQNSELAVKIAKAQFEAADKIIQESEDVTADSSIGLTLSLPQDEI